MNNINCLIAGLPQSGKSTYIGALWYVVQNCYNSKIVDAGNQPEDISHLNSLLEKWVECQKMRTSIDISENIKMNLLRKSDNMSFTLAIPDFRGETIENLISGVVSESLVSWCEKSTSLLYLVNDLNVEELYNNVLDSSSSSVVDSTHVEEPAFNVSNMMKQSKDMIILKYLKDTISLRKVVIGISAWDQINEIERDISPKKYLERTSPAFLNFLEYHFPNLDIIGVSAQGADYKYIDNKQEKNSDPDVIRKLDEAFEEEIVPKTNDGTRAFIVQDKDPIYDITIPIDLLIS